MTETPSAELALFETLAALTSASPGAWLDCATRLEIAADRAAFAGQAGQARRLRDRADESRRNARSAARGPAVTQRLPVDWAPRTERSTLAVHMPVALDLEFAAAVTQRLQVIS